MPDGAAMLMLIGERQAVRWITFGDDQKHPVHIGSSSIAISRYLGTLQSQ